MADPYDKRPSLLDAINESVKSEGFTENTPQFDRRKRQLHVLRCREMRGLNSCLECVANDVCSLYAQVKFDHAFAKEDKPNDND